jgi:hypothetical protein
MRVPRPIFSSALRCGVFVALLGAAPSSYALLFPQGKVDHALCCGPGGPLDSEGFPVRGSHAPTTSAPLISLASAGEPGAAAKPNAAPASEAAATPAAEGAAPAVEPAPTTPPEKVEGYLKLGFDRLASFKLTPPEYDPAAKPDAPLPSVANQIPETVKKFDGQKALVTGFMLPVKMDEKDATLVKEFLLVRDPMMCCYGVVPQMNEWIVVKMTKPVRYTPDVPASFFGQLRVKEMFENGYMTGIYLLEGERAGEVKG